MYITFLEAIAKTIKQVVCRNNKRQVRILCKDGAIVTET